MVLIIAMATVRLEQAGWSGWLIVCGLFFSLIGDICLMLPRERFVGGLSAFLLAHLCYIAAFAMVGKLSWISLATAVLLLGVALFAFRFLRPGAKREGGNRLVMAVGFYIGVIILMVVMAVRHGSLLLVVGAVAFAASDAILAWDRFVRKFRMAEMALMALYFLAQTLFALEVWHG
jgi:uncharacterized membrane protein YhhN